MPKRFTATEKWADSWFCDLSLADKVFWIFLLDNCNHAGIWQINWRLVQFHIQTGYKPDEATFSDRIIKLSDEKWFIPKFLEFQYGYLNEHDRVHQSVIRILQKEGVSTDLLRSVVGVKVKVEVEVQAEVRVKDKVREHALKLVERLKAGILKNNPKARITANLEPWIKEAEYMLRLDERTVGEVEAVIDFSQNDHFWKANILSMPKLRLQFDQLHLKSAGNGNDRNVRQVGAAAPIPGKYDHLG